MTESTPNLLVGTSFIVHWNRLFCVAFLPWDVMWGDLCGNVTAFQLGAWDLQR